MKFIKFIISLAFSFHFFQLFAQDNGGEKVSIGNFVKRMYNFQPFDGVKLLQTEDGLDYMVSVVALVKDPNRVSNIENRIASVKAKAYANQYVNGSNISSELIIISTSAGKYDSSVKTITSKELLKETSTGFVDGMELLTNFESNDAKQMVYVYYKEIKKYK